MIISGSLHGFITVICFRLQLQLSVESLSPVDKSKAFAVEDMKYNALMCDELSESCNGYERF